MDDDCTKCEYYLRSIVGECPQPCKMGKICMKCDAEWKGELDETKCPECKEDTAYNIYYNVIDWDGLDELFNDFNSADEYAQELIAEGVERIAIYVMFDNGLDTKDGEPVEHYGTYYEDD